MSEIEDLRALKERLILEKEVRRLERNRNIAQSASGWSWWLVGVPAALSAFLLLCTIGWLSEGQFAIAVICFIGSVLSAIPMILKIRSS